MLERNYDYQICNSTYEEGIYRIYSINIIFKKDEVLIKFALKLVEKSILKILMFCYNNKKLTFL